MQQGAAPGNGGAPIVSGEKDFSLAELIGDGDDVGNELRHGIRRDADGFAAEVIAALVRDDDAKTAADSGSICLCHEYQNSGKPWSRTTRGPSSGPAATACKPTSPFLKGRYSTERSPSVQCSFDDDIAHAKSERRPT